MSQQLDLPFAPARSARPRTGTAVQTAPPRPGGSKRRALERRLAALCDEPIRLVVNDNRSTMLTGQRAKGVLTIRMHHMFLEADDAVLRAVARFAGYADRRAKRLVDEFIEAHGHLISRAPRTSGRGGQGLHHDLGGILEGLNQLYFEGAVEADIAFGEAGRPRRRRRRSIKLGSYDDSARRIVIHPALDQAKVPRVFVEYIVFHEMLHQVVPPQRRGSSVRFHNAAFQRAERAFAGRKEAEHWYAKNADTLLRFRDKGG